MKINRLGLGVLSCIAATMMFSSHANAQVEFGFGNADFDNGAGVGATTTAGGITATIVDVFAPEFAADANGDFVPTGNTLFASAGDAVGLQIQSDDLGVDNPSVEDIDFFPFEATAGDPTTLRGTGNENRDINDGEGFVFELDADVFFTQIDFVSLDGGVGTVTITIEGVPGQFDFVDDGAGDTFASPVGTSVIPAGTDITITYSGASTATPATNTGSNSTRIDDFSVVSTADVDLISFLFDSGTEFDNGAGIGATTAESSVNGDTATITLVDIFARDFVTGALLSGASGGVTTQIQTGDLGIDNPSVEDIDFFPFEVTPGDPTTLRGVGNENRDINDGEGLTFEFNIPVIFTEVDFGSFSGLDVLGNETEPGSMITVTIEGVATPFTFVPDLVNNAAAVFTNPFGTDFIPAGADITIEFSSTTVSGTLRLNEFTVSTVPVEADALKGDADLSGAVDFADIPAFIGVLISGDFQAESDADCSTVVDFADIPAFIAILIAQ